MAPKGTHILRGTHIKKIMISGGKKFVARTERRNPALPLEAWGKK